MQPPIQTTHLIAQYLAAAAISFLERKADDSHTNLGFNRELLNLETHPLNGLGQKLVFDYKSYCLVWSDSDLSLPIKGKTHQQIVDWLKETATNLGFEKPYNYSFHYELPYSIKPNETHADLSRAELSVLAANRKLALGASEEFTDYLNKSIDIRIWPHHFDTGGYTVLDDGLGVGWGMAIPDSVVDEM